MPPFTLTVRPAKLEQPQPLTAALVRRQTAPAVLKFPLWPLVMVTGFEQGAVPVELSAKVAVTDRAALIATVQVPVVLVQAPLQPANVEPLAAAAVRVTVAVLAKLALHVDPQLTPVGDDVTVPLPVPALVTVSV